MMKSVVVDKIASVTQACGLAHELRIATDIPVAEGTVLVVEVLTNKSTYNTLELTSGRMAKVSKGDVIVGALGHRKALFGYSGHLPETLAAGDIIQLLNIGGVLGISAHTAKYHVAQILAKVGAATRAEAVREGLRHGWIGL